MSEALKLKRHLFITSVENAEGTQTWWVDAASKEDALAKFEAGNCEIYSSEVEVTKLGEPEYLGATSLDDFGDAENKTEIESLRAERDALMEKHFQAVEAQVKLIHERDAMKADAERYRWLRNVNPKGEIIFDHSKEEKGVFVLYIPFDGEPIENDAEMVIRMDAAIDAARSSNDPVLIMWRRLPTRQV